VENVDDAEFFPPEWMYSYGADMWAFGILTYITIAGKLPVWSTNLECFYPEPGADAGWTGQWTSSQMMVATSTAIAFVHEVLERDPNKSQASIH